VRYSAPFFYNPAYDTQVAPVLCDEGVEEGRTDTPRYSPIRWGDYRTQRFIGDYRDAGEEIQIEVFSN
jgi:isopenicillin N synthase-like dioxygenase